MCCFPEYYYDQDERTDEEAEPTFSEDEAVTQRGLRRSQSVKITRARVRKDVSVLLRTHGKLLSLDQIREESSTCCVVFLHHTHDVTRGIHTHDTCCSYCHQARYGSLKIKGKKRPALSSVNYAT